LLVGAFVGEVWFNSGTFVGTIGVPLFAEIGTAVGASGERGFTVVNPGCTIEDGVVNLSAVLFPASSVSEPGTGVGFCGSTLAAPTCSVCVAFVSV